MKPQTVAAHMIISGASFLCRPDPVWVCCENNRYCGYFIRTSSRNLVPHRRKGEWGKVHTLVENLNCPYTSILGVWTWSKLSNDWILHIRVNTYGLHCHPVSCGYLGKCMKSSILSSVDPSLCPLLAPSLPPPLAAPHLHPFCPLPLYLLLYCSFALSPRSAPEWPCHVGS